jgi:hypothetical protein
MSEEDDCTDPPAQVCKIVAQLRALGVDVASQLQVSDSVSITIASHSLLLEEVSSQHNSPDPTAPLAL